MWRIYFFNENLFIMEVMDVLRTKREAHSLANRIVKERGYYTYAIGKIK